MHARGWLVVAPIYNKSQPEPQRTSSATTSLRITLARPPDRATQDTDGGIAPRAPVPTAHPRHADRALSGVGATGLTAASTVLLFLCLAGRFVWVYKKEEAAASRAGPRSSPPVVRAIVVQRAVPPSLLPVFVHASDRGAPDYECCAVCLSEFGEREAGRLLPGCGHGFHEACIATWLQVNTTCPLCRAAVAY